MALAEPTSFFSKCPNCGHSRLQSGYARDALMGLLDQGEPIAAYCVTCDVGWSVAVQERYLIARGIAATDQRDTSRSLPDDSLPPQRRPPSR